MLLIGGVIRRPYGVGGAETDDLVRLVEELEILLTNDLGVQLN